MPPDPSLSMSCSAPSLHAMSYTGSVAEEAGLFSVITKVRASAHAPPNEVPRLAGMVKRFSTGEVGSATFMSWLKVTCEVAARGVGGG